MIGNGTDTTEVDDWTADPLDISGTVTVKNASTLLMNNSSCYLGDDTTPSDLYLESGGAVEAGEGNTITVGRFYIAGAAQAIGTYTSAELPGYIVSGSVEVTVGGGPSAGEITMAAATATVAENGTELVLTLTRSGGSVGEATATIMTGDASDTATEGSDYVSAHSSVVTWADGVYGDQTVTVTITDDADYEGDETFIVTIDSVTAATLGAAASTIVTIMEDDQEPQPGVVQLVETAVSTAEGDTLTITVTRRDGSDGEASVVYQTVDDTAVAGEDYTAATSTLVWADGVDGDQTFTIDIIDDAIEEGNETFTVELLSETGASLGNATETVTIAANDAPAGSLGFAVSTASVAEDAGTLTLTVSRSDGSSGAVSVDYTTADDSAIAGSDYTAASGTLTWTDGDAADQTIDIAIIDDADEETAETFTVNLSNFSGGVAGTSEVTVTIEASDVPVGEGEIELYGNGMIIDNGDMAPDTVDDTDFGVAYVDGDPVTHTFTIANNGTGPLILNGSPLVSISGSGAVDYSITSEPASTIAAGESTTFEITFDPTSAGVSAASIAIASDDTTDATYNFGIVGEALAGSGPAEPPVADDDDDDGCSIGFGGSPFGWLPLLTVIFAIASSRIKRRK